MVDIDHLHSPPENLVKHLQSLQSGRLNVDITLVNTQRQGVIQVREGAILSAHTGILHGNGAILTLVQMQGATIDTVLADDKVQKTVFITLEQITRFLAMQKQAGSCSQELDEEQLLQEAKDLFFRFHYKEAVDKLVVILRHNRFFYPAWLWQSRILTRQDYISRAIDEAYRWGNHDQDIWREARKIRPQLSSSEAPVKRCIFCWSLLNDSSSCGYCKARFTVSGADPAADLKQDDLQFALTCFSQALQQDPKNSRVAFALALGYTNLREYTKALEHLETAVRLSPGSQLYTKSLSLLRSVYAADKAKNVSPPRVPVPNATTQLPTILMIEDSMTSRKVLSMLLKRLNYQLLEAASGAEALAKAGSNRPQLILLDVMLPDTSGHDLLASLRAISHLKDVPVIMLTGRHDARDRLKGIQGGAQEYITKPFNPQRLTDLIQSYVKPAPGGARSHAKAPGAAPVTSSLEANHKPAHTKPAAKPLSPDAGPAVAASPASTPASAPKDSKSIFVIEDSRTSRKVLTMLLQRNGYHLYEAASGEEALTLAPNISPDLVLLDVMLPDTTGYTILPQLKLLPHFANLPFIMLTGNNKATDRMKGMLAGTNEYLTKPFDPQKLISVIGSYL